MVRDAMAHRVNRRLQINYNRTYSGDFQKFRVQIQRELTDTAEFTIVHLDDKESDPQKPS